MKANYKVNKILFDWLSFTTRNMTVDEIIKVLGLQDCQFTELRGNRGYTKKLSFGGVHINFGDRPEIWVEFTGQGCRSFEQYGNADYYSIFKHVIVDEYSKFTRIDIAYDDFNGLLDIDKIGDQTHKGEYISKSNSVYDEWSRKKFTLGAKQKHIEGRCITFGECGSNISLRIYDKAAERGLVEVVDHWVRAEIQLRHEHANRFIEFLLDKNLTEAYGLNIPKDYSKRIDYLYFACLNHYIRFVDINANDDTNLSRKPLSDHWAAFATSVTNQRVSLYVKPGTDYNISILDCNVENMYGASLYTYVQIHGVNYLLDHIEKHSMDLKPKYSQLIEEERLRKEGYCNVN